MMNSTQTNDASGKFCIYSLVTERIISLLEAGTVPWHKTWKAGANNGAPASFVSRKEYRGINYFLLSLAGFDSPFWLTYKQAANLGGNVRKGEKGFPVVFWKRLIVEDKEAKNGKRIIPMLRYYTVFNVSQCEGLKLPEVSPIAPPDAFNPIEACQSIVTSMPKAPGIQHEGNRACYAPSLDLVKMPKPEAFDTPSAYYGTLFHELTHATGHKSRLDRNLEEIAAYGTASYSKEELVAEMGAAFLCGVTQIDSAPMMQNSASYIAGWLKKLKDDKKLVVYAAAQAQKAADFIRGITFGEEKEESE